MNDEAVSLLRQILERVERIESHLGIASAPPLEPTPVQEQIIRDVARLGGRIDQLTMDIGLARRMS